MTSCNKSGRPGSFIKNFLLLVGSGLFGLLFMEVGLRIAGVEFPVFYAWDPEIGNVLRAGSEGVWRDEGRAVVAINDDGMRDRHHALQKPPNTLRIAILGDSYAEAFQVPASSAFWSVLERELLSCEGLNGRRAEVLNFGVSGYGTASELLVLRRKIWKYDPDYVLLAFFTGNDFRNNVPELEGDPRRAYFVLKGNNLEVQPPLDSRAPNKVLVDAPLNWLYIHSRVAQLLRVSVKRLLTQTHVTEVKAPDSEAGLDDWTYRPPQRSDHEHAWQLTTRLIGQINQEVLERGARLFLVVLSTGIQVNPDPQVRSRFAQSLGVSDLFYADLRLSEFARKSGIPHLLLAPELQRWAELNHTCAHGFSNASPCAGHWNEHGHHLAGSLMAREFCRVFSGATSPSLPTSTK